MYSGKTVLITGTSRGVGFQLAQYFLNQNAKVIGLSRTLEGPIGMTWEPCDLSKPEKIIEVVDHLQSQNISIDILINNAAVLTSQYATKMKVEEAEAMVFVDLLAPFILMKESVKLMKGKYGRIINISSMAVPLEPMGDSMYAACKSGLEKMTNIMAKELAFLHITCNTLGISAIPTGMLAQLNKDKIDKVVANLPIKRYAIFDDIINIVDFFCSERSGYITAQTIYLGGVHN